MQHNNIDPVLAQNSLRMTLAYEILDKMIDNSLMPDAENTRARGLIEESLEAYVLTPKTKVRSGDLALDAATMGRRVHRVLVDGVGPGEQLNLDEPPATSIAQINRDLAAARAVFYGEHTRKNVSLLRRFWEGLRK